MLMNMRRRMVTTERLLSAILEIILELGNGFSLSEFLLHKSKNGSLITVARKRVAVRFMQRNVFWT